MESVSICIHTVSSYNASLFNTSVAIFVPKQISHCYSNIDKIWIALSIEDLDIL